MDPIVQLLASFGIGSGSVGFIVYLAYQKFMKDKDSESIDKKAIENMEALTVQLAAERKENNDLRDSIERVANERNSAVSDLGALQAEVKSLETQVNLLTGQVSRLTDENVRLTLEIRVMHQQMMDFFKNIKGTNNEV